MSLVDYMLYVIQNDCVDSMHGKMAIISACYNLKVAIVSASSIFMQVK